MLFKTFVLQSLKLESILVFRVSTKWYVKTRAKFPPAPDDCPFSALACSFVLVFPRGRIVSSSYQNYDRWSKHATGALTGFDEFGRPQRYCSKTCIHYRCGNTHTNRDNDHSILRRQFQPPTWIRDCPFYAWRVTYKRAGMSEWSVSSFSRVRVCMWMCVHARVCVFVCVRACVCACVCVISSSVFVILYGFLFVCLF